MPTESAEEITGFVVRAIRGSPSRNLTGAVLGNLIKKNFPGFSAASYGCSNLKQFLVRFGSNAVSATDRAGLDLVYSLKMESLPESIDNLIAQQRDRSREAAQPGVGLRDGYHGRAYDPSVWSTFCSPSGPFRLFGNTTSGELRVMGSDSEPLGDDWVQVPSMTGDALKAIAQTFVSGLPDQARAECEATFDSERWWIELYAVLKNAGLRSHFQLHRQNIVEQHLMSELKRLGVPCESGIPNQHQQFASVNQHVRA